jgi:transposase-like protein
MVTNTTCTTEVVETGEKRDRIGRKITPAVRRAELVAAWKTSGLTQAEFARREGIIYSSFAAWVQAARLRRLRPGRAKPAAAGVRFVEARLPAVVPAAPAVLEVRLADGTVARSSNAVELAALVRALRA